MSVLLILGASDPMAPYYWAMWGSMALILLYILIRSRRRFPIERHTWLRCKPGTWIRRSIDTDDHGVRSLQTLVQTLKGIQGHHYQLEASVAVDGMPPTITLIERENSVAVDHAPVNLTDRSYNATVWLSREKSNGVVTWLQFYTPEGEYDPVGIAIESRNSKGKLMAVGAKEEVSALGRTFLCTRLEGDVRDGERAGRLTVWHCPQVPGSEIRSRLVLKDNAGEFVQAAELVEVHEIR
jgi:hypothetical protein